MVGGVVAGVLQELIDTGGDILHDHVHREAVRLKFDLLSADTALQHLSLFAEVDHVYAVAAFHVLAQQLRADLHVLRGLIVHPGLGIHKGDVKGVGEDQMLLLCTDGFHGFFDVFIVLDSEKFSHTISNKNAKKRLTKMPKCAAALAAYRK